MSNKIKIAILGLGTVGFGVYDIITKSPYLNNVVVTKILDKDFMAGIRANFIVKEDAGQQITLEDYINRLKKALVEAGKKLDKKKEDLKELIEVFEVYKENEEKSGLKDLEQKLKKHFSEK